MFYDKQSEEFRNEYKKILQALMSLFNLFSCSKTPLLYYRAHENIFCRCFHAENLAREDCSVDAVKGNLGIELKTFLDSNNHSQKIAEFNKLSGTYNGLSDEPLARTIAEYQNTRLNLTKKQS